MAEAFRSGLEAIEQFRQRVPTAWHEPLSDDAVHHFATGNVDQRSGVCSECDFPFEGNERVQCDQPDGSDVYCKRPDRSLLQDNREFIPACGFLSDPIIADFHFGQSAGKELRYAGFGA